MLLADVVHPHDAALCAEKIIAALDAPHRIAGHDLRITASIGIATYPGDAADAETLLRNADFAMYQAKYTGRNNYQFFKPEMNANAIERQSVETDLRQAVARREFVLNYQPKVEPRDGRRGGRRGADPLEPSAVTAWCCRPASFPLPRSRDSSFRSAAGRSRPPAGRPARGRMRGLSPISVAINVSAVELRAKDFLDNVRQILEQYAARPALSRARADRDLHDAGLEIDRRDPARAEGAGRQDRARRFRHRLLQPELHEALSDRCA